jgi:hypothetical protein
MKQTFCKKMESHIFFEFPFLSFYLFFFFRMSDDSPAAAAAAAQAAAAAAVASSSVPLVTTSQLSAHVRAVCALFWPPSATTQLVDAALARNEAPLATFIHDAKQATLVRKKKNRKKKRENSIYFLQKKRRCNSLRVLRLLCMLRWVMFLWPIW